MQRVLVVDDDLDLCCSMSTVLTHRGFCVDCVEDGRKALDYLKQNIPDVILLDLQMEGLDGLSTLQILREKHGDLPVIIITSHGTFENALTSIDLEVADFIRKPIDFHKLIEEIENIKIRKQKLLFVQLED